MERKHHIEDTEIAQALLSLELPIFAKGILVLAKPIIIGERYVLLGTLGRNAPVPFPNP
jgi:hypothetical protein